MTDVRGSLYNLPLSQESQPINNSTLLSQPLGVVEYAASLALSLRSLLGDGERACSTREVSGYGFITLTSARQSITSTSHSLGKYIIHSQLKDSQVVCFFNRLMIRISIRVHTHTHTSLTQPNIYTHAYACAHPRLLQVKRLELKNFVLCTFCPCLY